MASRTAVLPAPGEPMRLMASDAPLARSARGCARAVRSFPARIRSCTSTGTISVSPQPQEPHITPPPFRFARARSRRPRPGAPGARQSGHSQDRAPRDRRARQRGQSQRARPGRIVSSASHRSSAPGTSRTPCASSSVSTPGELADPHEQAPDGHGAAPRALASTFSTERRTIEYSCIGSAPAEPRRAPLEEARRALRRSRLRRRSARAARARGRGASPADPRRPPGDQALGDAEASVGPSASRRAMRQHLRVEALRREDAVDQARARAPARRPGAG